MHIFTVLGTANEQARLTSDASGSGWGTELRIMWISKQFKEWQTSRGTEKRTIKARGLEDVFAESGGVSTRSLLPHNSSINGRTKRAPRTWLVERWRVCRENDGEGAGMVGGQRQRPGVGGRTNFAAPHPEHAQSSPTRLVTALSSAPTPAHSSVHTALQNIARNGRTQGRDCPEAQGGRHKHKREAAKVHAQGRPRAAQGRARAQSP